ncbi:MAG: beta-propeller fold lactonase family protein [Bryobacterales bacterium]|nr:beta-propeller fold lactonase family protein [Bryobacterales bacterium]
MSSRMSPYRSLAALLPSLAATASGLFGQMLYVANSGDTTISAYVMDQENGLLTEVLPRAYTPGHPLAIVIHPSGKFAYATNGGDPAIGGPNLAAFSIDPNTGALALLGNSPVTPGSGPQAAAIDPAGKFVLVAHAAANNVSAFSIDAETGATTPVPGSPFPTPQGPNSIVVHPNGRFVYVSASGAGRIAAFKLGSDGTLAPLDGSPFAARNNLFAMAMDPAGKFLFATERQDNAVLVYSVNPDTGALTQVGSPFAAGPPGVTGVAVDSAGKRLFASSAGNGAVSVFNIGPGGELTGRQTFGAILGAFAPFLDPSGKFLYVSGPQANAVAGLAVDPGTGALSPLPQQFFPAGTLPQRGATVLLSPAVIPPISADAVYNLHSHAPLGMPNSGIAQGSGIGISGVNIGPAKGVNSDFPLTTQLGGVSVQIQSGDVTTSALMARASRGVVTAVIPSTTPLGDATVTLTYKDRTTAPLPITIVRTSMGLRASSNAGRGPAVAWSVPPDTVLRPDPALVQNSISLNRSAKPGQIVILQGTGLGPVAADETTDFFRELDLPVDVIAGNKPVSASYKLRVSEGSDFIAFKLPDDVPQGCYVPVAVRAGGVTSNVVTISVSDKGGSCSDPTTLSASDLDAAQKAGGIRMGTIVLSHLDLGPLGMDDEANGIFVRADINSLLGASSPGNNGAGIRSAFVTPALGTCTVLPGYRTRPGDPFDTPSDTTPYQYLNAGAVLNVNGPPGALQLQAPDYHYGTGTSAITPGDYTADNGDGTQAVGAFKAALTLPPMLTWSNQDDLASPDRTQDLTVTWSGGDPGKEFALIAGLSANQQVEGGFLCAEKVSAGKFTIPAWVLSSLPKTDTFALGDQSIPGGLLGVGTASFTNTGRFTAAGLDFGVLTYEQAAIRLASYR